MPAENEPLTGPSKKDAMRQNAEACSEEGAPTDLLL